MTSVTAAILALAQAKPPPGSQSATLLTPATEDTGTDAGDDEPNPYRRGELVMGAEVKRLEGAVEGGRSAQALTRAGHDVTTLFPELEPLSAVLGRRQAILDGELAAWDKSGRPDFGRLFSRLGGHSRRTLASVKAEVPVTWAALDVCYLDGSSFLDQPYRARARGLGGA